MAHNYILQVTAGATYDIAEHQVVPVNTPKTIKIESEDVIVELNVRIQNYRGLPQSSPSTSPYFSTPPHSINKDQYSIAFTFTPKRTIPGPSLVFGNDFDHPIRDRLPPLFNQAFKFIKYWVDPGLDGDVYADQPYLYGGVGSSVNSFHIHEGEESEKKNLENGGEDGEVEDIGLDVQEGGDEEGLETRQDNGIPDTEAGRKKWFLNETNRKEWEWEEGTTYGCDFFNSYLDFNEFALKLPILTLPIMSYWDGQPLRDETTGEIIPQKRSHTLRYVLKDLSTKKPLFVVLFTLYLKEDVDAKGNLKEGVEGGKPVSLMTEKERKEHDERIKSGGHGKGEVHDTVDEKKIEGGKENEKVGGGGDEDDDID